MEPIDSEDNEQGKTTKFVKRGALLWCVFVVMGICISIFSGSLEHTKMGNLFLSLNGLIYVLILLIPVIIFLAIMLKYTERIIDTISQKKK